MRGYSLVEVLAVIFVLGLIAVLVFPSLVNTYKQTEDKRYAEFVTAIKLTSEVYIESNEDIFNLEAVDDHVIITIADLVDAGLYNERTKNPKTNQEVGLEEKIKVLVTENLIKEYIYPYEGE